MKAAPEAILLLRVLSMGFPDGILERDIAKLGQSEEYGFRTADAPMQCLLTLLRTSLAHVDVTSGHICILAPIRSYVLQKYHHLGEAKSRQ
jgi:hypothetical protein